MKKTIFFIILIIILVFLIWGFWSGSFSKFFAKQEGFKDLVGERSLTEVKEKGSILIGTTGVFEPMSYRDKEGNLIGFDIGLAEEIAKHLGVQVEFKVDDFTNLLNDVESGKIDALINAVTITEKRSKIYSFSNPYFNNGQGIIVRQESENIKSEDDLAGKRIGVWRNTTCEIEARKYVGDGEVILYDNHEEIEALKRGEVDAVVIDQINAIMVGEREETLKSVGKMFSDEYYGIVMTQEDEKLVAEINKIIKKIKETGRLEELEKEWITTKEK